MIRERDGVIERCGDKATIELSDGEIDEVI